MFFVLSRLRPNTSADVPYSTYSDYSDGTKVFYDLLEKFDFRLERIHAEPYTLPDELTALFLLQPHDAPAQAAFIGICACDGASLPEKRKTFRDLEAYPR